MTSVITAKNLGKKYLLSHQARGSYLALRDVLTDTAMALGRRLIGGSAPVPSRHEEFWALQDVSFEIKQGERVGIIGRNGAGKSTLLKILSRITEPTTGSVRLRGRVASLLEVGTGFHPELTGRENIYLNGAILGMGRSEIRKKFSEIVEFAEIERFLDTPVKRYSSGMYVRLAFAVAAHLEPEILIVDEVLAVGDAQFQQKCMGKMEDVSLKEGRTVLFVSHNLAAVRRLTTSALLLSGGRVALSGGVDAVVDGYLRSFKVGGSESGSLAQSDRFGIVLNSCRLLDRLEQPVSLAQSGSPLTIEFDLSVSRLLSGCLFAVTIDSAEDLRLCAMHNGVSGHEISLRPSRCKVRCLIPRVTLAPGLYRMTVKLRVGDDTVFYLPKGLDLNVEAGDFFGTGKLPEADWGGSCLVEHHWQVL